MFTASVALFLLGGCTTPSGDILLSIDFPQSKPLSYKFVTNREVVLKLEGDTDGRSSEKEQKTTEGLEMVITYTPIESDIYGNTTVEAVCKSIKINRQTLTTRTGAGSSDPVIHLKDKKWKFLIDSVGEIKDYSEMEAIVKALGAKAITERDFVTTQWFMWDALSSNKNLYAGVSPGQKWNSALPLPFGVRIPAERAVEYSIDENHPLDSSVVTINSNFDFRGYEQKDGKLVFNSVLKNMPRPYEGSFQTRGMFGFLRDYKAERLSGKGVAQYDIKAGVLLKDSQQYEVDMTAAFMFPLGNTVPVLNVLQTIEIELIDE